MRLKIPTLNIDAAIEYVNLTPQGEMGVPNNTADVGWFDLGSRPGERGSAVIAGHLNAQDGGAGVFSQLSQLKTGDKMSVEDESGTSFTFVVRESREYKPGYADEVFSQNDGSHLNLITCEGFWDPGQKSYSKRLVVFTDMVE